MARPKHTKETASVLEDYVGPELANYVSQGIVIDGKPYPREELVQVDWKQAADAIVGSYPDLHPDKSIQVLGRASTAPDPVDTDGRQQFLDQAFMAIMSKYGVSTMLNKAYDLAEEMWAMREARRLKGK